MPTTRDMSDRHEAHVAEMMGGRVSRGSGCTFRDQADGRQAYRESTMVFGWDAKSTLAKSISVTRAMWDKIVEQANWARPMLALRFYRSPRLDEVAADLAVIGLADMSELAERSTALDRIVELAERIRDGQVQYPDRYGDSGLEELARDLLDLADGRTATRGDGLSEVA